MIRAIGSMLRDPLGWLERTVAEYGDLVALPLPRTPVLLLNTPSGARRVLQENHRNYTKQTLQYGSLSLVTGNGLLTSDGADWLRHRRIMQPAFHHGSLDQVAFATVSAAERLAASWDESQPGTELDMDAAMMRLMLEVVGRTLFADDLAEVGEQVVTAVDDALRVVLARARSPLSNGLLGRLPSPSRRRLRRSVATLDLVCADVVERRLRQGITPADGDLLAVLLRAGGDLGDQETGLRAREIRDELVTLVIAGHETVASSLTWTLHLLAGAPQVQERLQAELDHVLAGRSPKWSDLSALTYTRAVIDESLRLYPPAWVVSRRAVAQDQLDGVTVPAGTVILISPWLLHRDARLWPDPSRFCPERFLDTATTEAGLPSGRRRPGYLPFGAGPRLCIGRDFALVEATLVIATLLQERTVGRPAASREPSVDAAVTLRPKGGLRLTQSARPRSRPAGPPSPRC